MKIYLSGPVTENENYMEEFSKAEEAVQSLFNEKVEIINPAKILHELPKSITWKECMSLCYKLLDMADTICMLPGWEKSTGACIEYGYAYAKNMILLEEWQVSSKAEADTEKVKEENTPKSDGEIVKATEVSEGTDGAKDYPELTVDAVKKVYTEGDMTIIQAAEYFGIGKAKLYKFVSDYGLRKPKKDDTP